MVNDEPTGHIKGILQMIESALNTWTRTCTTE